MSAALEESGNPWPEVCNRYGHCPICAQPNGCRLETGEPYKGPCWCEFPTLSSASLRHLTSEMPVQRCICRNCLEALADDPELRWEALAEQRKAPTPATTNLQEGDL